MSEPTLIITNIVQTGAANDGDFLKLTVEVAGGQRIHLGFPAQMGSGLVGAIFAGLGLVHQEQLKRLGTDQAVLDHLGITPLVPTGFEVATGVGHGEESIVLLRLKKEDVPVLDVVVTPAAAMDIGRELQARAAAPFPIRKPQ